MATIEKRISAKGTVSWRVKIRIEGQAPINKTFSLQTHAKQWGKKIETEIAEGIYFPATKSKGKKLSDLIETYLSHLKIHNPRRINELSSIMGWWRKEYGHKLLQELRSNDFIDAQTRLSKKVTKKIDENGSLTTLSASTINRYMVAINTALNFSVKSLKWLQNNPMDGVKKFTEPQGRTRFLSEQEIGHLMDACKKDRSEHIFPIVLLGISTGRRKSAIMNLTWENVDIDTGRVRFWESKTKSYALSTISGPTLELLRRKYKDRPETQELVFPSSSNPKTPVDIKKAWGRVLKEAKIENFRFHDLRHTCASYLAMNGASLMELANILGHKTLSMVQRYAHVSEDHTAPIQKKMNDKVLGHVKI